jgi:hypothetical protein
LVGELLRDRQREAREREEENWKSTGYIPLGRLTCTMTRLGS